MENFDQQQSGGQMPPYFNNDTRVMSVSDWLVTLLIMIIPLVNIIMLFVWAFSDDGNRNRANWAKSSLLFLAIKIVLLILFYALFFGAIISAAGISGAFD